MSPLPAPLRRRRSAGLRLPLAALRATLDSGSASARWTLNADGVLGRALWLKAGPPYTIPLVLTHPVALSARAMLLPHDWRDGRGALRAVVVITDATGRRRRLWSTRLRAGARGNPRGTAVRCAIPADAVALHLRMEVVGRLRIGSVTRGLWLEPALIDPRAPRAHPTDRAPVPAPAPGAAADDDPAAPLVSVLMPVHDPPPQMLEEAIASVREQTFADWELCLVDDGSRDPEVIATLEAAAQRDPRIHLSRHPRAEGISAATNDALRLATGRFVALLDHDDTLTPDALEQVAHRIAAEPDLDMLYSDEDVVGERGLIERHIKPGWSPEHMAALMYTCHLGVYRRALADELGGFASQFDGCQDYDFVLRFMERTDRIGHIPRILYHWRAHARSTAGGDQAKPRAYLTQPGAIGEHLERIGVDATVQFGQFPGMHRIVHRVDPATTVDLVLAVDSAAGLAPALASWADQPHPGWRALIGAPAAIHAEIRAGCRQARLAPERLRLVSLEPGLDRASGLAITADVGDAEHLVLMQTPAIGLTHDWLTRLLGYCGQAGVAAAGPLVLGRDGRIEQGGIAIPDGVPLHIGYGMDAAAGQPVVYNVSAVSGVLATPREVYETAGGLTPRARDLALIDYCLRCGGRVVIVPDARVRAGGPDITTNDLAALAALRETWAARRARDPYYNGAYRTDRADSILSSL